MTDSNPIEQRLTNLEVKASFTEDLVDRLDQVIIRQQQQIDALISEVLALRNQARQAETGQVRTLRDELPPHY